MKRVFCEACGANNLSSENGYIICNYCGSRYLMKEESINTTSEISIGDDVAKLLAKCISDPKNARKYANLILDIDPLNNEAKKYL